MPRILPLLVSLAALAGCSDSTSQQAATTPDDAIAVAVNVRGVGIDRRSKTPVLFLEETKSGRVLPIWIGPFEARSIAAEIESVPSPRPNTHDLAKRLLVGLDATIERVTVTELRGNTYYAVVRVLANSEFHEFDARPSDAVAMALRFDAPVFVHSQLFDKHASERDAPGAVDPAEQIRL